MIDWFIGCFFDWFVCLKCTSVLLAVMDKFLETAFVAPAQRMSGGFFLSAISLCISACHAIALVAI